MIWFLSDTHFGHRNVIKYCNRPFESVHEMNEALIKNWNDRVALQDRIYVLGDFSFCGTRKTKEILSRLNGYKILIWGNHDKAPHKMLELGFDEVYESKKIILNPGEIELTLSHFPFAPLAYYLNTSKAGGVEIRYQPGTDLRCMEKRVLDNGETILLHGHTHSPYKVNGRMLHVGVDAWDYKPVSHKQVLEIVKEMRK